MTSEKQIDANRRNALLSTDPRTDAGRNRSRMNALRHGLTGQVTTMTEEDRAARDQFSKALMKDLAPDGAMEIQLAQRIATDSWRGHFDETARPYPRDVLAKSGTFGRRASAIEDNLFALGQLQHAGEAFPDVPQIDAALITASLFAESVRPYPRNGLAKTSTLGQQLQLLTVYEQRINRSIQKNLAMLQQLQAVRKSQHETAMQEAAALLKLSEMKGLEYQSTKDGFPFSNDQIHAAIDRQQRLERASTADFSKYRPRKFQTVAA